MFVRYMAEDVEGIIEVHPSGSDEYFVPEWGKARALVEALDGKARTYVMFSPSPPEQGDEQMLVIRAAGKGMYVCEMFDGEGYLLINPLGVPLAEPLLAGEFAFNSTREFVDLETVLSAARTYYETGERDSALHWEQS